MSEAYKVVSVGDPREWSSQTHGGRFYAWPLTLEGVNEEVEWSRKATSDEPRIGDVLWGDIQGGAHGLKLKLDWDAMKENQAASRGGSRRSGGSGSGSSGREYKPEHEFDPAKTARITRSHSQKVAVDLATSMPGFGESANPRKREVLREWTDFFESDVEEAAAQKTAQGAGGNLARSSQPSPAPAQTPPEDEDVPF